MWDDWNDIDAAQAEADRPRTTDTASGPAQPTPRVIYALPSPEPERELPPKVDMARGIRLLIKYSRGRNGL